MERQVSRSLSAMKVKKVRRDGDTRDVDFADRGRDDRSLVVPSLDESTTSLDMSLRYTVPLVSLWYALYLR